jgi:urease accessory protein
MSARAGVFAAIALLLTADAAVAHAVLGVTGFAGGLLHPLLVPSHICSIVALALLAGQQRWLRGLLIVFAVGLVLSLGAIALAYVPTFAEAALLSLAAVTGALVALARPLPMVLSVALAAATGVAIGFDSPPETISIAEANLALLGTALGAPAALVALAWFASRLHRDWQRIGMRIAGSWIAASAIMVLTLRLGGG